MNWYNLKDQLPPVATQVNIAIGGKYYVGSLDTNNNLQVTGYTPSGILTSSVYWAMIPQAPQ